MKKLFHVLVVGGAVIGTGAGCAKPKSTHPDTAEATPSAAPAAPKPDSDTNGTPPKAEPAPQERGGGAGAW